MITRLPLDSHILFVQMDCEEYVMTEPVTFIIPYDILHYIFTFLIFTNKDAWGFWMICRRWQMCIERIYANLNPTWDFQLQRVLPLNFPIYNAIWDDKLYALIKNINDYGEEIVNDPQVINKTTNPKIDLTLPNILEIYDRVRDYTFTFRLKCPCTIWNHNATVKLTNENTHKGGPIIQTSFSLNSIEHEEVAISLDRTDLGTYLDIHCKLIPNHFGSDLELSMESIFELEKKMESSLNENSDNFLLLDLSNGRFTLGMSHAIGEWIPFWSSENLPINELVKIHNSKTNKEKEGLHFVRICVIKTWINHLKYMQPFDFISLKSIIPLNGRWGKGIYSSVVKDDMSMYFQF